MYTVTGYVTTSKLGISVAEIITVVVVSPAGEL